MTYFSGAERVRVGAPEEEGGVGGHATGSSDICACLWRGEDTWQLTWHPLLHEQPRTSCAARSHPPLSLFSSSTSSDPTSITVMTRSSSSFVDPTTLSLPSAANSPESSTSSLPSTSTSAKARPPPSTSADGPPRKRSRTDMTPEERKEARAHRNRIAAQNSRDKRKAQFAHLEQRIAELESENRTLRASMGLTALRETEEQKAAEQAREQENRELRERIRTLESGWDAIIKALQTHGLPAGIPGLTPQAPTQTPTPRPEPSSPSSSHPTTFPVFVPPSPVFPLSPAPSQSSLSSSSPSMFDEPESTRHLARVATTNALPASVPQQRVASTQLNSTPSTSPTSPWASPILHSASWAPLLRRRSTTSTKRRWKTSSARFSHPLRRCPPRRYHFLLPPQHPRTPRR
ncbi:hypothetical protein DENSPDRAFT_132767 [Dentipellis sp. KUC8613]|nr:hypothetical protein DENSPDRAFT_132767 [Dentipellis sp. KUC8613]